MRKILTAALAALTIGGTVVATTTPASAMPFGGHGGFHGGYGHGYGRGYGPAIGAGLLGLAVGASLAPHYGYVYGPGCVTVWRWDPYMGRNVPVERCY